MSDQFPSKGTGDQLEAVFQHYVVTPLSEELSSELDGLRKKVVGSADADVETLLFSESKIIKREITRAAEKTSEKLQEVQETTENCAFGIIGIREGVQKQSELIADSKETTQKKLESLENQASENATNLRCAVTEASEQIAQELGRSKDSVTEALAGAEKTIHSSAQKIIEETVQKINERSLQICENSDSNLASLQASLEKYAYSINENIQRISTEVQVAQTDGTERILSAISETSVVVNKIAKQQEENHQQVVGQLQEMETIHERRMEEVVSSYQRENTYLKKMMYISWAISGTTLAATITSILIQLL